MEGLWFMVLGLGVWDSGFGFGARILGLGCGVREMGFGFVVDRLAVEIWRLACMVGGFGLRLGLGLRVAGAAACLISGFGFQVSQFGFRISHFATCFRNLVLGFWV